MKRLTCGDCNYYRPEVLLNDDLRDGICLCHGYHIKSKEEICADFER